MLLHDNTRQGTSNLSLRIGLNSGPTTAGVLRGEKARFQLFGDVSSTAPYAFRGNNSCRTQTACLLITLFPSPPLDSQHSFKNGSEWWTFSYSCQWLYCGINRIGWKRVSIRHIYTFQAFPISTSLTIRLYFDVSYQSNWLTAREELIEPKGKGTMQTYWCDPVTNSRKWWFGRHGHYLVKDWIKRHFQA